MSIVEFPARREIPNRKLLKELTNGLLDIYNPLAVKIGSVDRAGVVCFET